MDWKNADVSFLLDTNFQMLRIQDVYPGSEFFHPGPRIRVRIKEFKYFKTKNCF